MSESRKSRAIFLDRDGTVIRDAGYIRDPGLIEPIEGAVSILRELSARGWRLIVITNQSGVGRGLMSIEEMVAVQREFEAKMREAGAPITATYACVHAPEQNCECRKPSPSLLFQAARINGVDLRQSWMVGDRESDILSGRSAGCSTIWLRNNTHAVRPDLPEFIADNWPEVRRIINAAENTPVSNGAGTERA